MSRCLLLAHSGTACASGCVRDWLAADDRYWPLTAQPPTGATFAPPPWAKTSGKGGLPNAGFGMHRPVADDTVALAEGVVEAGPLLAARSGLDPEAGLADLDGLEVAFPGQV